MWHKQSTARSFQRLQTISSSINTSAGMRLLESCGWILHERLLMTVPTWMYHPITSLKLMTLRLSPTSTIIFYFYWWGWKDCHDMFRAWRSRPLEKKPGMLEVPWLAVTRLIMIREYTVKLLLLVAGLISTHSRSFHSLKLASKRNVKEESRKLTMNRIVPCHRILLQLHSCLDDDEI